MAEQSTSAETEADSVLQGSGGEKQRGKINLVFG